MERHFPHEVGVVPERCGEKDGRRGELVFGEFVKLLEKHSVSDNGDAGTTVAQSQSHRVGDGHRLASGKRGNHTYTRTGGGST